jgi:peptide/nickel transport system ATP-binding protein
MNSIPVWIQFPGRKSQYCFARCGIESTACVEQIPAPVKWGAVTAFLIARVLLLDIQFLVADEIISMLDASVRIDVLNLLAELKKRGLSVLFITHDLSLANYISENAIILYHGCIAEKGSTERFSKIHCIPIPKC